MKSLIVSLHDVSPLTFDVSRRILDDLGALGIHLTSLLVIPDHHHRGHFLKDPPFCKWLQQMQASGHEIVTHGYFHQREQNANENVRDRMMTRFYTAGEGEFYDIAQNEAVRKMTLAQKEFFTLGIVPVGFIAPAWLLSGSGESAARKCGFRYTTTLTQVREFNSGKVLQTQSLVYSVRSTWRRIVSIGWNRFLLDRLTTNPVVRLAIHPPDWEHPEIRAEILRHIQFLSRDRQATTYAALTLS